MLRFTVLATLVALTALAGTDTASSQTGKPTGRPRPARKAQRMHGHSFLHPKKMRSLGSGKHHVHTHNGHRLHASLKNGKVHHMHVTDRRGRQVAMHKKLVRGRATHRASLDTDPVALALAGTDLEGEELMDVSQVGLQIFVVFTFQDPTTGQTILIFFPLSSVGGIQPPANPITLPVVTVPADPDGGDDDM